MRAVIKQNEETVDLDEKLGPAYNSNTIYAQPPEAYLSW